MKKETAVPELYARLPEARESSGLSDEKYPATGERSPIAGLFFYDFPGNAGPATVGRGTVRRLLMFLPASKYACPCGRAGRPPRPSRR